jgi:hypothetical protein
LKRNIINNTIGDWRLLIAFCFLFYPIRKRQPAIDNVVIKFGFLVPFSIIDFLFSNLPLTFILSPQGRGNFFNRQSATSNVVIESTEFPYCQIALLPDFLIF